MTQQINLFAREVEERKAPLLLTIFGLVAFSGLLLLYYQVLHGQRLALDARVKQTARQLEAEAAAMKSMKDALAQRTDPARVAAELAALKSRAADAQEIVERLRKGELGTLEGFGGHFTSLAQIGEPGLWLTKVSVHNAGRVVEVEGRALQAEAVLRYATAVNRQVAPLGATVTSLELTPITNVDKSNAVAFKLF